LAQRETVEKNQRAVPNFLQIFGGQARRRVGVVFGEASRKIGKDPLENQFGKVASDRG
jgi:hypothetical protein